MIIVCSRMRDELGPRGSQALGRAGGDRVGGTNVS